MSTPTEPSYRKRISYQGALLGGFATFAGAALILGNLSTHEAIAQRKAEDLLASLGQVIPAEIHDNNLLGDTIQIEIEKQKPRKIYLAKKGESVTAVAYGITANGYAGAIDMIMGVDSNGKVLGVRVLAHAETPGLGDKIEEKKSDWILKFNGLSLGKPPVTAWAVKKDGGQFDQFSGATITPRGVVKAIKQGLVFFNSHKLALLQIQQPETKEADSK